MHLEIERLKFSANENYLFNKRKYTAEVRGNFLGVGLVGGQRNFENLHKITKKHYFRRFLKKFKNSALKFCAF